MTAPTDINVIPIDQRRQAQLTLIIQCVYRMVVNQMPHYTDDDLSAAVCAACQSFFNDESAATAIETGRRHARDLIQQRLDEQSNVIPISRLRIRRAQPDFNSRR